MRGRFMQNCLKQTDLLSSIPPLSLNIQDKKAKQRLAATTDRLMTLLNEVVIEKAAGPKSSGKTDAAYYGNVVLGAIKGYLNSNPELIDKILQEGPSLLAEAQKRVDSAPLPSPNSSKGDSADSMAIAMMCLTSLQAELIKNKADQDLQYIQLQTDNVAVAVAEQTHIANEVAEQNREIAEEANAPWYEKLLKWFVPIVVVVASFCTAGAGVAIAAALVGAFMASPLYGKMVDGISSAVSKALQDAGMPADKADAIGNIVGKISAAVIVVALTLGVGGVSSLCSSTAKVAAEAAPEVAGAAAGSSITGVESIGGIAENATTSTATTVARDAGASLAKRYMKMAAFEFTTSIGTSGIAQDALTAQHGSDWVESHSSLVAGITITSTIVGVIATIAMGKVAFGGLSVTGNLLEKLPAICRAIIPLSYLAQATQGGVETALAFVRAKIKDLEAATLKEIGVSQSELSLLTSILDLITDTQSKNDSSADSNTKLIGSEIDAMKNSAGKDWSTAASILA